MITSLYQVIVPVAVVGAATALAALNIISGSDALGVLAVVLGAGVHATGVSLGAQKAGTTTINNSPQAAPAAQQGGAA